MKSLCWTPEQINSFFPVCGVTILRGAVIVRRTSLLPYKQTQNKKKGQKIKMLSKRSLNNFALTVSCTSVVFRSLLTLTYGGNYPIDGKRSKAHLRSMLDRMKKNWPELEYFWFLEFQGRGAPHFHLGLNIEYPGREVHNWMAHEWAMRSNDWIGEYDDIGAYLFDGGPISPVGGNSVRSDVERQHRRKEVWENFRSLDGAIRYCLAYISKPYQKSVPCNYSNVGRFWGVSSGVTVRPGVDFSATESEIRELMATLGRDFGNFEVLPKILFHSGNLPENFSEYTIK